MTAVPSAEEQRRFEQYMEALARSHQLSQSGQLELAEQTGEQALALARTLGVPCYEASAMGNLVGIHGLRGRADLAIETGLRALAIAAAIPEVSLCTTIHGVLVCMAAPEINKLNRQFGAFGAGGQLAEALRVAADLRRLMVRLGDPVRLASFLAAEGQLFAMQGRMGDSLAALERAFDVAIPGGAYDLLPRLIGILNTGLKEIVFGAMGGVPGVDGGAGIGAAAIRLGARARAAEAVVRAGASQRIAAVRSQYNAASPAGSIGAIDALLREMEGSADRAALADGFALKASFVGAQEFMTGGGSQRVFALYGEALGHAVAAGNARTVWSVAAGADAAIANAREAGGAGEMGEAALAARAEDALRPPLQQFVAALSQ
jgi:hypothetical protein